jgi:hypothetical protein
MNALQTLLAAAERGVLVTVTDDGDLAVKPKDRLTPELKAALRENKEEIVSGKRPRSTPYDILEIMPVENWYVILRDNRETSPPYRQLHQLVAWARIYDHEGGYTDVEGLAWEGKGSGWRRPRLVSEITDDSGEVVEDYLQLTPEEAKDKREWFEIEDGMLYQKWQEKKLVSAS